MKHKYFLPIAILLLLIVVSCERNSKDVEQSINELIRGTWFGSFDCTGLTLPQNNAICYNIYLTFSAGNTYKIELENFSQEGPIQVNSGRYDVEDDILVLTASNCINPDAACIISTILSNNKLRIWLGDLQIEGTNGWYGYEKKAD